MLLDEVHDLFSEAKARVFKPKGPTGPSRELQFEPLPKWEILTEILAEVERTVRPFTYLV
jgi:hypothetical protein